MTRSVDLAVAATFVLNNGRLLDRLRYAYLFEGAASGPVLRAIAAYQNDDGGFGNALDPDLRDPHSQPIAAAIALDVLVEVGDPPTAMVARLLTWLRHSSLPSGGLPQVMDSAAHYPHAPWWQPASTAAPSVITTAAVVAGLWTLGANDRWIDKASRETWEMAAAHEPPNCYAERSLFSFLRACPDQDRAHSVQDSLTSKMLRPGGMNLSPDDRVPFGSTPLDLVRAPGDPLASLFSPEVIDAHLDRLADLQQADGGWPLATPVAPVHGDNFEPCGPEAECAWRAMITIQVLKTLRAFGRIPTAD